ncbi:MAG: hypothetical protein VX899_02650 [Myxococcota bacterium]|nr:hypothetical protein [Myxococcota bacterium]
MRPWLLLPLLALPALAAPVHEALSQGHVDWTRGVLVVTASGEPSAGAPKALEITEQQALNRLQARVLEEQRLVRLSSQQSVGQRMQEGDELSAMLMDSAGNFTISEARYYASGRVELTAELPLQSWLRPVLVAEAHGKPAEGSSEYSGVVIDARGLSLRPCLSPRVLDREGEVLYSLSELSPDTAKDQLPVAWVGDPADGEAIGRAGDNPLFLSADSAARGGDVVLDPEAAQRFSEAVKSGDLLASARLVIVADS